MATSARIAALVCAALLAATAGAGAANVTDSDYPRALAEDGPVAVRWSDPAQFSEIRYSGNRWEARRGDWVRELALYLRQRAAGALAPGERLEVVITDIDRAGDYEYIPGRADNIRILRDIHPPRIELEFTRHAADGSVVAGGERRLTDLGYLQSVAGRGSVTDPLRHEKHLIDRWVRQELGGR